MADTVQVAGSIASARPGVGCRRSIGFTLVETLVALLVLSLGIAGLLALQLKTQRMTVEDRQQRAAILLADEWLGQLQARGPQHALGWLRDDFTELASLPCDPQAADPDLAPGCWWRQARSQLPGLAAHAARSHACFSPSAGSCGAGMDVEIQLVWQGWAGQCHSDSPEMPCRYQLRGRP